jgi:TetR/AcrR family transcriptional regulator, transcriptional repressor of bet genes
MAIDHLVSSMYTLLTNWSTRHGGSVVMARTRISEDARKEQILQAAFEVARRVGISGLTVRAVATEAEVSHALVLFHFGRKDHLIFELLESVIARTAVLHVSEDIARFPHARDRLHALLQQEMVRQARQPEYTRLFLEYWALGARDEAIRTCINAHLEQYRAGFVAIMEEVLSAEPTTFARASARGLAAVAVSWINGCAVQAMIDPVRFDTDEYLAAVQGMIG